MESCLIGYTGFIGKHLDRIFQPSERYNSTNIEKIRGKSFDTVYFSGNSGVKWLANKNHVKDYENISKTIEILRGISAKRFVLISTIDVYSSPILVNESSEILIDTLQPYGQHRYQFELFVREAFKKHFILRLPVVYGEGFKKNVIYDLINKHEIEKISPDWHMQFYNINNIGREILYMFEKNISLLNIATEPLSTTKIANDIFDTNLLVNERSHFSTNMLTKYSQNYNHDGGGYLYSSDEVMDDLLSFSKKYVVGSL